MTGRFAAPELLALGRPPSLAASPYEDLLEASRMRLVSGMAAAGINYDVSRLETDPAMIVTEEGVYRTFLRRQSIDDAVAQTYLGSATGGHLDQRAADYGVLRRSLPHALEAAPPVARPLAVPPAWSWDATVSLWREDDDSLRLRARLAWEALSVAGPAGAYIFHALDAHPSVFDAVVYGPESGHVEPGEVLVVLQSSTVSGIPTLGMLETVAARLDAYELIDAAGVSTLRLARDAQSVRPLGARVTVAAPQPISFAVTATLYVSAGTDVAAIETVARERLVGYLASRRRIGREVPRSGLIAALHMVGPSGIPVIDEVTLTLPAADVLPEHNQLATVGVITILVAVR